MDVQGEEQRRYQVKACRVEEPRGKTQPSNTDNRLDFQTSTLRGVSLFLCEVIIVSAHKTGPFVSVCVCGGGGAMARCDTMEGGVSSVWVKYNVLKGASSSWQELVILFLFQNYALLL